MDRLQESLRLLCLKVVFFPFVPRSLVLGGYNLYSRYNGFPILDVWFADISKNS